MSKASTTPRPLLTVPRVADSIDSSERTVHRLIKSGELRACRIGKLLRVHPDELDRYIQKHTK